MALYGTNVPPSVGSWNSHWANEDDGDEDDEYSYPYANHGAGIWIPTFAQHKSPSFVGKYTSTMEHLGYVYDDSDECLWHFVISYSSDDYQETINVVANDNADH